MDYQDKLQQLREDWKNSVGVNRKIIEQRAKLIKWAMESANTSLEKSVKDLIIDA